MNLEIDGRRALVTAASRGLGRAIACALAAEGAEVIAVARNAELLRARRLEIDFATRAYTLDKGHVPANNTGLVPEYLKALPKNPTTGKTLN